jgi:hypothetical protein
MSRNRVAVEKLALHEFAEIASRQEALQTIFPSLLDIFYYPISDFFKKTEFFNSHSPSHHQSHNEIAGDTPCSRHLSSVSNFSIFFTRAKSCHANYWLR